MNLRFTYAKSRGQIRANVYIDGVQKTYYVGSSKKWDSKRCRTGDPKIDEKLSAIEVRFNSYLNAKTYVKNFDDIKKIITGEGKVKAISTTLVDVFDLFMEDKKNVLNKRTLDHYQSMKYQVELFQKKNKCVIKLDQVNRDFYARFIDFCITECNNVNKTINRKIKFIKTIMAYANEEDIYNSTAWDKKVILKDTVAARVPLNEEERKKLWKYKTNNMILRRVVDAFLFSIYSGLRFEDLRKLSRHHIFEDVFNDMPIKYINMTAVKGVTKETIPVLDIVQPILDRYINNENNIFNLVHNGEANHLLKYVCRNLDFERLIEVVEMRGSKVTTEMIPLHKLISFHFGRYTYMELQERSGLPVSYIQRNMNHSKIDTTNGYMRTDVFNRIIETRKRIAR